MISPEVPFFSPPERSDLSDLRDKFACAAMAAFITLDSLKFSLPKETIVKYSWEIADEMLKARGEVK